MSKLGITCGLLLCALGSHAAALNPAVVAVPRETTGTKRWVANHYRRMMALAEESPEKFQIVFVGDSITKKWLDQSGTLWADNFGAPEGPFYALNLGVPGDRTEHLLYRLMSRESGGLGNLDDSAIQPKVMVLMIGTNNLFPPHTAEQIHAGIAAVAERLVELRPHSKLILCSVLPTANAVKNQEQVIPVNAALPELADRLGKTVLWLNLFPSFLNEQGEQEKHYFADGLHLNEKGYEVWLAQLMPMLNKNFQ